MTDCTVTPFPLSPRAPSAPVPSGSGSSEPTEHQSDADRAAAIEGCVRSITGSARMLAMYGDARAEAQACRAVRAHLGVIREKDADGTMTFAASVRVLANRHPALAEATGAERDTVMTCALLDAVQDFVDSQATPEQAMRRAEEMARLILAHATHKHGQTPRLMNVIEGLPGITTTPPADGDVTKPTDPRLDPVKINELRARFARSGREHCERIERTATVAPTAARSAMAPADTAEG